MFIIFPFHPSEVLTQYLGEAQSLQKTFLPLFIELLLFEAPTFGWGKVLINITEEENMPLAFDSTNHGSIAFGFFNIDSDMLLLEHYFFFASEFCQYISSLAEKEGNGAGETVWQVFYIADQKDIGDLMGAIHGIQYTGFIGETYRQFPFPQREEDFKQKPEGYKTRFVFEIMIGKYADVVEVPFSVDDNSREINIGDYKFTRAVFHQLINYVWRGGYPRWKDEVRPDYVAAMKTRVEESRNELFDGIVFEE
jgi:hypothetical protein